MLYLLLVLLASTPAAPNCPVDRAAAMALDYQAFDETMGKGWRPLGDIKGCEVAAADLIAAYRTTNAVALVNGEPDHLRVLDWHEGQLRAAAGQTNRAIPLLERGSGQPDDSGQSLYNQATVAFLKHDHAELVRLRDRIAALPEPEGFAASVERARQKGFRVPPWPVFLGEVEGFLNCFDRPYAEAYTLACRTQVGGRTAP